MIPLSAKPTLKDWTTEPTRTELERQIATGQRALHEIAEAYIAAIQNSETDSGKTAQEES